jgi:undecaprenyl-diphosphatase
LLVLIPFLGVVALCGLATGLAMRRWTAAHADWRSRRSAVQQPQARGWLASFFHARVDPVAATGLELTIALGLVALSGAALGVLVYLVRSNSPLVNVDRSLSVWGAAHATSLSTAVLRLITALGDTVPILTVTLLTAAWESRRLPSRSVPLFLGLVVVGQNLIVRLIQLAVSRARPTLDPLTIFSGSSFPSRHAASAAACYTAIALLAGRRRSPRTRSILAGVAVAIAVAVAGSRVLLGVHWLTDVLAGLAMGWGWLALCKAFAGWLVGFSNEG